MSYKIRKTLVMIVIFAVFSMTFIQFTAGITSAASDDMRASGRSHFETYVVKSGDTLWSIAEHYISAADHPDIHYTLEDYIDEIKTYNHLGESYIREGQLLVIPFYNSTAEVCTN